MRNSYKSSRTSGFSLVETALSLAVFGALLASIVALTVETSGFVGAQEAETSIWIEATRGVERASTALRKSGAVTLDSTDWPRVLDGGQRLEFRLPADLDGDGTPFAAENGALEWDSRIYAMSVDSNRFAVITRDGDVVRHLARDVHGLRFETNWEDPNLRSDEVRMTFTIRKGTHTDGSPLETTLSTIVHMRNSNP